PPSIPIRSRQRFAYGSELTILRMDRNPQNHLWRWVWLVEVAQALTNARKSARGRTSSAKNWKKDSSESWRNSRVYPARTTISERTISAWLEITKSPKK